MKSRFTALMLIPMLLLNSCAILQDAGDSPAEPAAAPAAESAPQSADTKTPGDDEDETAAPPVVSVSDSDPDVYRFDRTVDYIELDDKFYYCYTNRLIRFDGVEMPYKDFLSYESPYDAYVTMFYDDRSGEFGTADTAAFAIRYACENNIEYLDFPLEYGTLELYQAWEYARLTFPNLPLETINSDFDISEDGRYRIHLTNALRKIAGSEKTLEEARKIVDGMPASCKTKAQKAYYLYDWICQNVVYDSYHLERREGRVNGAPQSAYGALVEKRAVCDGIAGALQLLFSIAGIECGKVDSFDYTGGAGHVWNVAEIDGETWDFDATWDIHRFYESAGDEITTDTDPGYYQWFGVERTAKTVQLDINDTISGTGSFTSSEYTAKSPACLSYDMVISADPETLDETYFVDGKAVDDVDIDMILDKLEKGECVAIKFNNSLTLALYWAAFTDSEVALIDYETYSGYPDTELLEIEIFPTGFYSEDGEDDEDDADDEDDDAYCVDCEEDDDDDFISSILDAVSDLS